MWKTTLKRAVHFAVLTGSLQLSSLAFSADEPAAPGAPQASEGTGRDEAEFYPGEVTCEVRNLRGAFYYGHADGRDAYARACDYAFDQCYRDTVLRVSCHVSWSGPSDQPAPAPYPPPPPPLPPPPPPPPYPAPYPEPAPYPSRDSRFCDSRWDLSDATACGAPDGNGRQWYCSPRNNWCVLP